MEQMQRRREGFRMAIRRSDLDEFMKIKRAQLAEGVSADHCRVFIEQLWASRPSMLFIELSAYLSTCPAAEYRPWALVSWEMLTCRDFDRWSFGFEGLAQLLLAIDDQLSQQHRAKLASSPVIEALIGELERAAQGEEERRERVFSLAFQLSIYASKQSNFHINLDEEMVETAIRKAHASLNTGTLQVLACLLINSQLDSLRGTLQRKMISLGRKIWSCLYLASDRLLCIRVLGLIGIHCQYERADAQIAYTLLNERELDFQIALRFASLQSEQEWITFEDLRGFLMSCPSELEGYVAINHFLAVVINICRSECYSGEVLATIYRNFFSRKLHHFTRPLTVYRLSDVIVTYILEERPEINDQLTACALKIIRMGKDRLADVEKGHLQMLCSFLMASQSITQAEMFEMIGEQEWEEFWEAYVRNNESDIC